MRLHVAYVGSGYYPLSWYPLNILDSEQDILLEDSKDPPKTATAVSIPARFRSALQRGVFDILHMAHV